MLRGTAQGILLVVVRGTDDALRTVILPLVLAAAKKGVETIIEQKGSSLDLGVSSVQLTRLDSLEYLDLTIAKEVEEHNISALNAISGENWVGSRY